MKTVLTLVEKYTIVNLGLGVIIAYYLPSHLSNWLFVKLKKGANYIIIGAPYLAIGSYSKLYCLMYQLKNRFNVFIEFVLMYYYSPKKAKKLKKNIKNINLIWLFQISIETPNPT